MIKITLFHKLKKSTIFIFLILFSAIFALKSFAKTSSRPERENYHLNKSENRKKYEKNQSLRLKVKSFVDISGKLKVDELKDEYFTPVQPKFNPGLFQGQLWIDIETEKSESGDAASYVLLTGMNALPLVDCYEKNEEGWKLFSSAGYILHKDEMEEPSAIPYFPFTLKDGKTKHFCLKISEYTGNSVDLKILTRRSFSIIAYNHNFFSSMIFGGIMLLTLFLLLFGFLYRDKKSFSMGLFSFFYFILSLQVRGYGPVYLWNWFSIIPHSERMSYFFAFAAGVALVIALYSIETDKNEKSKSHLYKYIFLNTISSVIFSLLCIVIHSPGGTYLTFNFGLVITFMIIFIMLLEGNSKNKKGRIFFNISWGFPCSFILFMQIFRVIRLYSSSYFFTIFDNSYVWLLDLSYYFFITPPVISAFLKTSRMYKESKVQISNLEEKNSAITEECEFLFLAMKEQRENSEAILQTMNLPGKLSDESRSFAIRAARHVTDLIDIVAFVHEGKKPVQNMIELIPFVESCQKITKPFEMRKGCKIVTKWKNIEDKKIPYFTFINRHLFETTLTDFNFNVLKYSLRNSEIECTCLIYDDLFSIKYENVFPLSEWEYAKKIASPDFLFAISPDGKKKNEINFQLQKKVAELYGGNFSITLTEKGLSFYLSFNLKIQKGNLDPLKKEIPVKTAEKLKVYEETEAMEKHYETEITDSIFEIEGRIPYIIIAENTFEKRLFLMRTLKKHAKIKTVENGRDLWNTLMKKDETLPDIILTESSLPVMDTKLIMEKCSRSSLLKDLSFVGMFDSADTELKNELKRMGLASCLEKPFSTEELLDAIYSVWITISKTTHKIISNITNAIYTGKTVEYLNIQSNEKNQSPSYSASSITLTSAQNQLFNLSRLSKREIQIAMMIAEGKTDKDISSELSISLSTVQTHNKSLFKKLDVHSRVELINKVR